MLAVISTAQKVTINDIYGRVCGMKTASIYNENDSFMCTKQLSQT